MAAKNGRLDQLSLEKALEAAFDDQPESAGPPGAEETMIHGYETVGGVDANLAAQLHDKLASQPDAQEPSEETGMRAPACTRMLTGAELAELDDSDDEGHTHKVVLDTSNHGKIDQIDSKLVTELNKKLSDEVAHIAHPASSSAPAGGIDSGNLQSALAGLANLEGPEAKGGGFDSDLSAAFAKLEGKAGGDDLTAAIERRFSACDMPTTLNFADDNIPNADDILSNKDDDDEKAPMSGLRAPQPTVKLSAAALAELESDDEVVDSALLVAQNHGAIDSGDINSSLVAELQKQLGGGGKDDGKDFSRGCMAPSNTQKLDISMLPPDEDEDIPTVDTQLHGNIDAVDSSFVSALQGKLERQEDHDIKEEACEHVERGCRAPHATVKLDPAMLNSLEDDEEEAAHDPMNLAASAAAMLSNMDPSGGGFQASNPGLDDNDDGRGTQSVGAGLRAPEPTKLITADMLADLDDDDIPCAADPSAGSTFDLPGPGPLDSPVSPSGQMDKSGSVKSKKGVGFSASFAAVEQQGRGAERGEEDIIKSGMRAPATTQVLSSAMLDEIDDDDPMNDPMGPTTASIMGGPSADQLATLAAAAVALSDSAVMNGAQQQQNGFTAGGLSMDGTTAQKAIQNARGIQEGTDMWGQARPLTSSCKLRLAWLSKDEVRKENNQLRQEISSLRAEIDMHRKEATLARKG